VRKFVEIRDTIKESVLRDLLSGIIRDKTVRIGSSCYSDRRHVKNEK